jgi:hypothetical protein
VFCAFKIEILGVRFVEKYDTHHPALGSMNNSWNEKSVQGSGDGCVGR